MLTGRLTATTSEKGLAYALSRIIGKGGEPLIRQGVQRAMRLMGEQFVTWQTIAEALPNSRSQEKKGFRYSYDMLGEAAITEADAQRYFTAYGQALHAIGKASHGRGIFEGPGLSVKLSALHPRYSRAQYARVMDELLPRLTALVELARRDDLGIHIDAEEADRLELSLDLLEALCLNPALKGWNGIGFVVQAYQKRGPLVIDHLIDLARRSGHRLMVRLVKGDYWDSEIKRAHRRARRLSGLHPQGAHRCVLPGLRPQATGRGDQTDLHGDQCRGGAGRARRLRAGPLGPEVPHGRVGVAPRLGPRDPVLRIPAGGAPSDLHHKRDREHQRATAQDHQDPRALPQRRRSRQADLAGPAQHHGRLGPRGAQLEGGHESIRHPLRRTIHPTHCVR